MTENCDGYMGKLMTIMMAVIAAMVGLVQPGCYGDFRGWIRRISVLKWLQGYVKGHKVGVVATGEGQQIFVIATGVLLKAEDNKVDCASYKGRLRFTGLSMIAEGVG